MKSRHKRLMFVGGGLAGLAIVAALLLQAFNSNMVFFFSPSDVAQGKAPTAKSFRLGGLVEDGSVQRQEDGITVNFVVTDKAKSIPVSYKGILPDLFREGQGVIAQGKFEQGYFVADEVLAKHDEEYMAPEVADALKKAEANAGSMATVQTVGTKGTAQ
ncbi:MAG: cytochrome c maturation protein CcmE [Gammaproteobacteria bacterium]|nr:cytochrome c maturation protein CcmE [Gammaproteobacteria bacterium]MDH5693070.1 cytochrome c maturation protein CcmE [Gammaproteobacteria bacterium]